MYHLKIFLISVLLIHNANSSNFSRPPLLFPPRRIPYPPGVVSSNLSTIAGVKKEIVKAESYTPLPILKPFIRPLPISKHTETIAPSEAEELTTEKLILIYPINQAIPSRNLPPTRQLTVDSPSEVKSIPLSTTSPITTIPRRTIMQKYSTPLPTRYTTKGENFSPISSTTTPQWSTTVLSQHTTTTLQPTSMTPYSTTTRTTTPYPPTTTSQPSPTTTADPSRTTPQLSTITTSSPPIITSPSTTTTPYQSTTTSHPSTITTAYLTTTTQRSTRMTLQPKITTYKPILVDFTSCNSNQHYATTNECDSYIECKEHIALKKVCPDGLQFKADTIWPDYPCAYPSEVKCTIGALLRPARPTAECPRQYGFYSINDGDCSKYVMCQEGVAIIMNCPLGLVFNNRTSSCDWPVNVPECNPEAFKNFKCPTESSDNDKSSIIFNYKYLNSCDKYIACHRGYPRLLSCDQGLSFDENLQACVDSTYVKECDVTN